MHIFTIKYNHLLRIYLGDPLKIVCAVISCRGIRHSSFMAIAQLSNTSVGLEINGQLLNSEAQSETVLNCHARNLNNSTSSLTSTIISFLSSHDSKLKVSSQMCCSSLSHTDHTQIIDPQWLRFLLYYPYLKGQCTCVSHDCVWGRHGVNTDDFNMVYHYIQLVNNWAETNAIM